VTHSHAGTQSDFKIWREENKIANYLPDEYQYPGSQNDECA